MIEGLLEADELADMRAEVEAVLAAPVPPGCERPHNRLAPLGWGNALVARVIKPEQRRDTLRAALRATDLRWISGYVSVKDPHSEALEWHQDWWCWDHPVSLRPEPVQVAVMVYLSETSKQTAALRVMPGTHRDRRTQHKPVTLAVRAGTSVACDYRLMHGTHPNDGEARRDCLILNFTPAWRSLPDDVRAHLIRHPARPGGGGRDRLLPDYDGEPRDLPLNRVAPTV